MIRWMGSATVIAMAFGAMPVLAQDKAAEGDDILVLGTRAAGRLVEDSPSPADVFSGKDLEARGLNDLSRTLQFLAPSFNYARSATAPSAANTRAASLRGLAPDQVLVLVNGKRWHGSSVINFNNVIGRGSVPVDLNAIPMSAIARVEILRDGAAAQYGSDAIAGVINITLKSGAAAGFVSGQAGVSSQGDGATWTGAFNHGFALGQDGSINLTGEVRSRARTNRAGIDSRFGRITNEQGDPQSLDLNVAANLVKVVGDAELYGDIVYAHRRSTSSAQYRAPTISAVYPLGFVPHIRLNLDDLGGTLGIRGALGEWRWDLSDTIGLNDSAFGVSDSVNTSLGLTGPTAFDGGGAHYVQNVAGAEISRALDILAGGNIAFGGEHRYESFRIRPGDPASYGGAGAQGFPGFNPPIPVDEHRSAWSAYADGELSPIKGLTLGAAVRHEHYSDFGNATTGKVSLFFKPVEAIALRATASTGFRAPSLQQRFFSTVTSQSSGGVLVNIGTFAVSDPVAIALGAQPLRREKSKNLSAGFVIKPFEGLVLTADVFRIAIDDRIALSETLSGAAVTAILKAAGITNASQARFFTNALDTTTKGYEVTANWRHRFGADIRANVTASYARVDTDIDRLNVNAKLPTLPLLGAGALGLLTTAQPKDKIALAATLTAGPISLNADIVRFGEFTAISVVNPQTYGAVTTIDLTAELAVSDRFSFGLGILNVGDAYPDKTIDRNLSQGGSLMYPEVGAVGTNGREYYVRATVRF